MRIDLLEEVDDEDDVDAESSKLSSSGWPSLLLAETKGAVV